MSGSATQKSTATAERFSVVQKQSVKTIRPPGRNKRFQRVSALSKPMIYAVPLDQARSKGVSRASVSSMDPSTEVIKSTRGKRAASTYNSCKKGACLSITREGKPWRANQIVDAPRPHPKSMTSVAGQSSVARTDVW